MATPQLVVPSATRRQLLVGATAVAATGLTAGRASAGIPRDAAPGAPAAPRVQQAEGRPDSPRGCTAGPRTPGAASWR